MTRVQPLQESATDADKVIALLAMGNALVEKLAIATERIDELEKKIARLEGKGVLPTSERSSALTAQVALGFVGNVDPTQPVAAPPAQLDAEPVPAPRGRAPGAHGRRLDESPADETMNVPASTCCPKCQNPMRHVTASTARRIDWRPGRFVRIAVNREISACTKCPHIETAPEPGEFALSRSMIGNGLAAKVVVDKFADNIPLNRQSARFAREGLMLGTNTLCPMLATLGQSLGLLVRSMLAEMVTGDWIQTDDTGVPVQDGTPGATGPGRFWAYVNQRHVVLKFTVTKKGCGPLEHLRGFKGILLADGGSEFNAAVRAAGHRRAGCWCHARRYFVDALRDGEVRAGGIINLIEPIFALERSIKDADLEVRRHVRNTEMRGLVTAVRVWLDAHALTFRPKSGLMKGIRYALNQWEYLTICLDHPELPIHNNRSELTLRSPVTGRKNWLFAGSEGGAVTAAIMFSLMQSCALHKLDPWLYLNDVLGKIGDYDQTRLIELSPAEYAARADWVAGHDARVAEPG